ncbi:unnamed protein product (macronuclear) [Paramecium tetraurelia]|uniref:RING-type domain-containing protein n=1 Tax=Paramecium tetraurelia TaxID=5888 RepID=A0BXR0_PARTE|nr:uncharacterized protein GSPATT00033180001 [Paramecium tetraurelia]CAK63327.1 unnamed protein product [Paramecium tetraurelia]|eukprot:XP_001430725.1 hypothetical protein (macronuclear) [Paramecium tetraurelia strain d4-2]
MALPLLLTILYELVMLLKCTEGKTQKKFDHLFHILLQIYVITIYYLGLNYYIFCNTFLILSFIVNIGCNKTSEDQYEHSTIIRLTIIFYRFCLIVSVLCITLKLSSYVNWSWAQTFWWYWMFLSGLVGTTITILLILISKLFSIYNRQEILNYKSEVKTLIWTLYTSILSSLIAGTWIINTLNILDVDLDLKIGDCIMYILISFNIVMFSAISKYLFKDIVEFALSLNQLESRDSSPNTPCQDQRIKKEPTKTQIFLQKFSSAYFKQIKDPEIVILKCTNQNEIDTERNTNNNKIVLKSQDPQQQSDCKCIICCERPPNAVLMTCGHGGICYQCAIQMAQKNKECFLCRQNIKEIYEISDKDLSILKRVISKTRISS